MIKKAAAIAASVLIVLVACIVSPTPSLADAPQYWIKTDGINEITPALTKGTASFADDDASDFVHEIQWANVTSFPDLHFANATDAVQWVSENITYESDAENYGYSEAWANPEQTLNRGRGDCEDMAFLIASLFKWHTDEVNEHDLVYAMCGFTPSPEDGLFYAGVIWWDSSEGELYVLVIWWDSSDEALYAAILWWDPIAGDFEVWGGIFGEDILPGGSPNLEPASVAMNSILDRMPGTLWLNDEHVFGYLCGYYPALPTSMPGYDFIRISESGIDPESGDRHNSYAWSMDVLPTPDADYLYVGSNRDFIYPLVKSLNFTEEEILEIFEGDIPIPVPLEPPCYPVPGEPPVPDSRGRIFRCQDHDPYSWEMAYISPIVAHPNPAFPCPVPRYTGYRAMRTFTDVEGETALYVATTNLPAFPAHILKFGQDYVPGTEPEIVGEFPGVSSIRSLVVHDGKLYASSFGGGCQIWESDNPSLGNWVQVAQPTDFPTGYPAVPAAYPRGISAMVSFDDALYVFVGVSNLPPGFHPDPPYNVNGVPGGFWGYKSASPAVGNWTETMSYGAGNHWNEGVSNAKVFGDYVYVGTAIGLVAHMERLEALEELGEDERLATYLSYLLLNWKGGDVLRFDSDDNWEMVIGDPCKNSEFDERVGDFGAGFCNPCNVYLWWMDVYQDELYVGTFDFCVFGKYLKNMLFKLCPYELGEITVETQLPACVDLLMGADLWVTENGASWNPVTLNGFGNMYNYGVRSMAINEDFFVGTANPFYGAEVWWKKRPQGDSTDEVGVGKDTYTTGETVYATGSGFPANTDVDVYIVRDFAWTDGMAIPPDVSSDGVNYNVPTDAVGSIGPTDVWPPPLTPGEYDLVFDANQNGTYDDGIDVVDHPDHPGFVVAPPLPPRVPSMNQWGIFAMIILFTGLLLWTVRRRQPAL